MDATSFPSSAEFAKGQLNPAAYHLFAPIVGVLVGAAAFLTTHLTRNEIPYLLQPLGQPVPFSLKRVLAEVLLALRNRDFLVLFMTLLTASAIGGTTEALNIYVQTYFWELNGEALRWFALAILGFMAAFAVIPIVQARFDKKRLVIYGLAFLVLNGVAMIGLRFLDVLPANGSPLLLPLLITQRDHSNRRVHGRRDHVRIDGGRRARRSGTRPPGRRQEGVFSAALSFSTKATSGLGVLLGGLLLDYVISFPRGASPESVDPATVRMLGVIAGIGLPLLFLFPFSLISRYRITRETHAEIRRQLDERHRSTNGADAVLPWLIRASQARVRRASPASSPRSAPVVRIAPRSDRSSPHRRSDTPSPRVAPSKHCRSICASDGCETAARRPAASSPAPLSQTSWSTIST